ncbi:hypothetical protein BDR04DRAFT_704763 [Suillus decipiens]|nr:hypothetical protein BDR04DRAFT_704763 [Suillus decipiens]
MEAPSAELTYNCPSHLPTVTSSYLHRFTVSLKALIFLKVGILLCAFKTDKLYVQSFAAASKSILISPASLTPPFPPNFRPIWSISFRARASDSCRLYRTLHFDRSQLTSQCKYYTVTSSTLDSIFYLTPRIRIAMLSFPLPKNLKFITCIVRKHINLSVHMYPPIKVIP